MDKKTKALMLIAADPKIRRFLVENDPKALEQVETALGADKPTPETHPQTFEALQPQELTEEDRSTVTDDFLAWTGGFKPEDENQISVYLDCTCPLPANKHQAASDFLKNWMDS